jgi:phosphoenolpyruvate-protein kinase (PTS system EI component)
LSGPRTLTAESGGFPSHSTIVARECGIPAVVSVVGAKRLPEGTLVRLDGYDRNSELHTIVQVQQLPPTVQSGRSFLSQ